MHRQDYQLAELHFAYCYHAYLRWGTHRVKPCPPLARLGRTALQELADPFGIRISECQGGATEVRLLVSLKPEESVSACASKLKGRTSRWLREARGLEEASSLLAK